MKETAPRGLLPGGIANPLRKNNPIANTRQNRNNNSAIKMFDHLEFLLRNQKRFGVVGCCCCCDTDSATLGALFAVFLLHFGITFSDAFQHSALLTMASFGPIFVVALNYLFIP